MSECDSSRAEHSTSQIPFTATLYTNEGWSLEPGDKEYLDSVYGPLQEWLDKQYPEAHLQAELGGGEQYDHGIYYCVWTTDATPENLYRLGKKRHRVSFTQSLCYEEVEIYDRVRKNITIELERKQKEVQEELDIQEVAQTLNMVNLAGIKSPLIE